MSMVFVSLAGIDGLYDLKVFFGVLSVVDLVPLFWNRFRKFWVRRQLLSNLIVVSYHP